MFFRTEREQRLMRKEAELNEREAHLDEREETLNGWQRELQLKTDNEKWDIFLSDMKSLDEGWHQWARGLRNTGHTLTQAKARLLELSELIASFAKKL